MVEFGAETHTSSLFLDDFFAYLRLNSHRPGPKVVRQKNEHKQTDIIIIIRENLADLEVGRDPVSDPENTDTARKSLQNESEN